MRRSAVHLAALALASLAALVAAGCGSTHRSTPVGVILQREDLALAARALEAAQTSVESEAAAAKAAWPSIANGLPAHIGGPARARIHEAALLAHALPLPHAFNEATAAGLTGPASGVAGTYESFYKLASRGWALVDYGATKISEGPSAAARFARANIALYIDSIYDAQFALAQLGGEVQSGYYRLGGAQVFGTSLSVPAVERLAKAYSPANFLLQPHDGVRLGS